MSVHHEDCLHTKLNSGGTRNSQRGYLIYLSGEWIRVIRDIIKSSRGAPGSDPAQPSYLTTRSLFVSD